MGFLAVNFELAMPSRSQLRLRHRTDRRTDRRTTDDGHQCNMPTYGTRHNNYKQTSKAHSVEMQINAVMNAFHCGFSDSQKIVRLEDRRHFEPKSNQQASTECQGLVLCQVSSHCDQRFSFYHDNVHTHAPHTHIHTCTDKVIAISAPPYCVVCRADTNNRIVAASDSMII